VQFGGPTSPIAVIYEDEAITETHFRRRRGLLAIIGAPVATSYHGRDIVKVATFSAIYVQIERKALHTAELQKSLLVTGVLAARHK
jgi:hypothetical protein